MITTILSFVLCTTFTALSGFHFYWFFGGNYGVQQVIPTKKGITISKQSIPPIATLIVALGLLSFAMIYAQKTGLITISLPSWIELTASWLIPSIFFLRAIGDFNYVGFFKKVKDTPFSKSDSKFFTPLCVGIGVSGFVIQLLH